MSRLWWGAMSLLGALAFGFACSPSGPKTGEGGGPGQGAGGTPVSAQCEEACIPQHPAGEPTYAGLRDCLLCGACFDTCSGELPGLCGEMAGERGCSLQFPANKDNPQCGTCIDSACALEQLPDTMFQGACAAEGNACAASQDCVGLNNCVVSCIEAGGPPGQGGGAATGGGTASGGAMP